MSFQFYKSSENHSTFNRVETVKGINKFPVRYISCNYFVLGYKTLFTEEKLKKECLKVLLYIQKAKEYITYTCFVQYLEGEFFRFT